MTTKVKIGLTADSWNEKGQFIIPGPGLRLLDDIPQVVYGGFQGYSPEVTAEQVEGFDLAVSMAPKWTGRTLAGKRPAPRGPPRGGGVRHGGRGKRSTKRASCS